MFSKLGAQFKSRGHIQMLVLLSVTIRVLTKGYGWRWKQPVN